MKAKFIKEGIENLFGDDGNSAALRSWTNKTPDQLYEITITEPATFKLDKEKDYYSLKFLFQKYRVKFTEKRIN